MIRQAIAVPLRDTNRRLVGANTLKERMLPPQTVAMLVWSLAITGLGDARFNDAIFYRGALMTTYLFAYFYFATRLFVPAVAHKKP
jgi:hypothetical protein